MTQIRCKCSGCGHVWDADPIGGHRLVCGDSTDAAVAALAIGPLRPVLLDTDPPYGVDYDPNWRDERGLNSRGQIKQTGKVENDDRVDWAAAFAHFPGDVAYVWHAPTFYPAVQAALAAHGFLDRYQIVWAKQHFVIGRGDYHRQHESCIYAVRTGRRSNWQGARDQATVWTIDGFMTHGGSLNRDEEKTGHGTQKPAECMARPMRNNSKPGDAVYDPFMGSGTTIIAAHMLHRIAAGVELNPAYVDMGVRRWQEFAKAHAVLAGDGRTFDAIAALRGAPAAA